MKVQMKVFNKNSNSTGDQVIIEQLPASDQDIKLIDQIIKDEKQVLKLGLENNTKKDGKNTDRRILIIILVVAFFGFISLLAQIYLISVPNQMEEYLLPKSKNSLEQFTDIKSQGSQKSDKTAQNQHKKLQDDEDQQFQVNFVQTQFQGKQTQQMLTAAALSHMQNQISKFHFNREDDYQQQQQKKKLLEDISNLKTMIPDQTVKGYMAPNFYFFSVSIQEMLLNSQLDKMYRRGQTIFKISIKQHMRAIIRTQLVHNVNFKGQVQVELSPFDKGVQQKRKAIKQIMDDEQVYYESFYELSKYNKYQLRFCILVPSYNNVKYSLYLRNLDSIFMQDYDNYHVVYIDDASPDNTGDYVRSYIQENKIPAQKVKVYTNEVNKKALYNIYNGIHSYCPDGQIVGLIDGDDSLLGRKVLQLYNAVYQDKRTGLIYSNFLKILTNNKTSFGFGTQVAPTYFYDGKMRTDMSLVGTHFMTFFSDIFKKIKKQDLSYQNGTFYDYAYDRAIITPMIQMAFPRVLYLPEITYEYRNDTGINDGTEDWERVSKVIMAKPAYQMLNEFPFIDSFIREKQEKILRQKGKANKQSHRINTEKNQLPKFYFVDEQQDKNN